jgi:hypothetical protein
VGGALNTTCSTCAQKVCNVDPFCCSKEWDSVCVQEATSVCGASCGNTGGLCGHDECSTGSKLTASCSACATSVCNFDPYCCNNNWDAMCVQYVAQHCSGKTCGSGGSGSCGHDECSAGGKLNSDCSSCASVVCNIDPYCCSTNWDDTCIQEAAQYCNKCESSGSGSCAHDVCATGGALTPSCSACSSAVCNADSYCCNNTWDDQCVDEAEYYCNTNCGSSGTGGTCSHDECVQGGVLEMGCSSCVNTVCGQDSYCCDTQWDTQCVEQAVDWCSLSCGSGGGSYCAHSECSTGAALSESCSSCASAVCDADPYCCSTAWDWTCIDTVNSYCSMSCT